MGLECGIVGLPNVGKSTLFNALTASQVPAENFPFCTVDPNRGVVFVPDPRLDQISELVKPQKTTAAMVTFVDIAGLVKGASQGEGLGNQFLSHIREVNAIIHVVRCFQDPNVIHVMGDVEPGRDVEIIDLELCLSDLESMKKRVERIERVAKAGDPEARVELETLRGWMEGLSRGVPLRRLAKGDKKISLDGFLTSKPVLYVANIGEVDLKEMSLEASQAVSQLKKIAEPDRALVLVLSVALEQQLVQLSEEDREVFLKEFELSEPGLHRLIREAYRLLGLITYFTAGPKEVRAWTIQKGTKAPQAAGVIHSDFERGFIRAETTSFKDFMAYGGEKGARERGLVRSEGKDYEVSDGDIILFKFGV